MALQTQEPFQTATKTTAQESAQSVISATGFKLAETTWSKSTTQKAATVERTGYEELDPKALQRAARATAKVLKPHNPPVSKVQSPRGATATACTTDSRAQEVLAWAESLPKDMCNPEQRQFCRIVAARVAAEVRGEPHDLAMDDPLRWVLHGGPGTGKSHTLNLIRKGLFEETLGWQQGVEYQVVTFQAVMAEALGGDTIHHALGLNWTGGNEGNSLKRLLELSLATLQWRWLLLDEFSMVSAELFAQLERRCREIMRDISAAKYGASDGMVRPFGGLNIILAGDLYQLPPPRGTFVGDVPWQLVTGKLAHKTPVAAQGQQLIWGGKDDAIQGVTELTKCERNADQWLASLQNELREGNLSPDSHAFLHGQATSVPGSWCQRQLTCADPACRRLVHENASPEEILRKECCVCQDERKSRRLVATDEADERLHTAFRHSTAIPDLPIDPCFIRP